MKGLEVGVEGATENQPPARWYHQISGWAPRYSSGSDATPLVRRSMRATNEGLSGRIRFGERTISAARKLKKDAITGSSSCLALEDRSAPTSMRPGPRIRAFTVPLTSGLLWNRASSKRNPSE